MQAVVGLQSHRKLTCCSLVPTDLHLTAFSGWMWMPCLLCYTACSSRSINCCHSLGIVLSLPSSEPELCTGGAQCC